MALKYMIFGDDARQEAIARRMREDGKDVVRWKQGADVSEERALSDGFVFVLPMPLFDAVGRLNIDGTDEEALLEMLTLSRFAFGGRIRQNFLEKARTKGIKLCDYSLREDFAAGNALITAEAAVEIAMENTPFTVSGARVLVAGCGRIGKELSMLLKAMGAVVTVSARKSADFAWIENRGMECADTRGLADLKKYDILFNTVPALVFTPAVLDETREDALIIDLASMPGGVDFAYAEKKGRKTVQALGLPAKYAPESAARCVCRSIYEAVSEEGYDK